MAVKDQNGPVRVREQIDPAYEWLTELIRGDWCMLKQYLVGIGTITPEATDVLLEMHNKHNRDPITRNIDKLAKAMDDLTFQLNGDTIVFDSEKQVRNGSHRLRAAKRSGKPFETFIVAGVSPTVFDTYDQHSKRTTAQVLKLRGETEWRNIAAGIQFLSSFFRFGIIRRPGASFLYTIHDEIDVLSENPELRGSAAFARTVANRVARRFGGHGQLTALHYLLSRVDAKLAEQLFDALVDCTVPPEDRWLTIRKLVKALLENMAAGCPAKAEELAALIIKGWNSLYTGKALKVLHYAVNESFPRIAGWTYSEDGKPLGIDAEVSSATEE